MLKNVPGGKCCHNETVFLTDHKKNAKAKRALLVTKLRITKI